MERTRRPAEENYDLFTTYDDIVEAYYLKTGVQDLLSELLEGEQGNCLDLGCGTGFNGPLLQKLGFNVIGLDISKPQIETARERERIIHAIQADAAHLPFQDGTIDVVASCFTHTDIRDWENTMNDVHRVLKPGGSFVYAGPHPCFFGAQAEANKDGTVKIHPGYYGKATPIFEAPGFSNGGIRQTVGERHLSFSALINSMLKPGLTLQRIHEAGPSDPPVIIGIKAIKPVRTK